MVLVVVVGSPGSASEGEALKGRASRGRPKLSGATVLEDVVAIAVVVVVAQASPRPHARTGRKDFPKSRCNSSPWWALMSLPALVAENVQVRCGCPALRVAR